MFLMNIPKEYRADYLSDQIGNSIKEIVNYHNSNGDKIIEVIIKSEYFKELLYTSGLIDDDDLDLIKGLIIKTI